MDKIIERIRLLIADEIIHHEAESRNEKMDGHYRRNEVFVSSGLRIAEGILRDVQREADLAEVGESVPLATECRPCLVRNDAMKEWCVWLKDEPSYCEKRTISTDVYVSTVTGEVIGVEIWDEHLKPTV